MSRRLSLQRKRSASQSNRVTERSNRRGVKKMKYAKPELTTIVQAERAIHGGPKNGSHLDTDSAYATIAAYEADE